MSSVTPLEACLWISFMWGVVGGGRVSRTRRDPSSWGREGEGEGREGEGGGGRGEWEGGGGGGRGGGGGGGRGGRRGCVTHAHHQLDKQMIHVCMSNTRVTRALNHLRLYE